jgi:hypothetical protein
MLLQDSLTHSLGIFDGELFSTSYHLQGQDGRLYIHKFMGHVLCEWHVSLKGFIPYVLNPNLIFLISFLKSLCFPSKFLHCIPSAG